MAVIEAIQTTYLEANASSVTFSSIPQTYEHLQLRYTLTLAAISNTYQRLWLGDGSADTGTTYSYHVIYAHDSSAGVWKGTGESNGIYLGQAPGNSNRAWTSPTIVDIFDYVNTNKNTTVQVFNFDGGDSTSTADYVTFASGLWDSTAAVDTILINNRYGNNFLRGSEFSLYGIQE